MSPERAQAYRRVTQTLEDLGPAKLLDHEQEQIRFAADGLIFSSDLAEDEAAREALDAAESLCGALVQSGRWEQITATRLLDDLYACGPVRPVALNAA
jgi:hypothetical protein